MTHTDEPKITNEVKGNEGVVNKNEEACSPTSEKQDSNLIEEVSSPKLGNEESMVNGEKVPSSKLEQEEISKEIIRNEVWEKCSEECKFKIPRFIREPEAVERLINLDVFKCAKVIATTLDKTLELVRREAIQAGKDIIIGTPGLKGPGFRQMKPPAEPKQKNVRLAASSFGMKRLSKPLEVTSDPQIDLIVLGSVAVDKMGNRIGKGKGFADLEIALLSKMGRINNKSLIGTLVDDFQVFEKFQGSIFQAHDVLLDFIITPTRTIFIRNQIRPILMKNLLTTNLKKKVILKKITKEENKGKLKRERCFCGKSFVKSQ